MWLPHCILITLVLFHLRVPVVHCSFETPFIFCHDNSDCDSTHHQVCSSGICDCVSGAVKLSDNRCIMLIDEPRSGKALAAGGDSDSGSKDMAPRDYIPDWALYASVFFGFVGMVLIAASVSSRTGTRSTDSTDPQNAAAIQLNINESVV